MEAQFTLAQDSTCSITLRCVPIVEKHSYIDIRTLEQDGFKHNVYGKNHFASLHRDLAVEIW